MIRYRWLLLEGVIVVTIRDVAQYALGLRVPAFSTYIVVVLLLRAVAVVFAHDPDGRPA